MAVDRLVSSICEDFQDRSEKGSRPFRVWVKRYESGKVRVLLPDDFEVRAIINGGNSPNLKLELMPT